MNHFSLAVFCCAATLGSQLSAQSAPAKPRGVAVPITKRTTPFNDNWKFHLGDVPQASQTAFNDAQWRALELPHDFSIEGPFDPKWASGTSYLPGGIGWYRKTFTLPAATRSKRVAIYFDGIYNNSEIWINGHYLGKRPSGFTPIQHDLTPHLSKTGPNTIAVRVDHSKYADSRWYTGSGIYRSVHLVTTDPISIDQWGVSFSTPQVSAQKATAKVSVSLTNRSAAGADVTVKSRLLDAAGKQVAGEQKVVSGVKAGAKTQANFNLALLKPTLWSVENPALYRLEVSLESKGKKIDEVTQAVGFRNVKFDAAKGFFLNGVNMKLKGLCIHEDGGALGVAVPKEVWARRLKTLKAGGCNSLRMSHNPQASYIYDLCDEMGILVMDEAFDEWEIGKNKWVTGWNQGVPSHDGYHEYFAQWAQRDIQDMVRRNRNHPSIILWSIGNEVDYPNDPYSHPVLDTGRNPQIYGKGYQPQSPNAARITEIARKLVADVKAIDQSRPITAALAGVVMSNEVGFPELLDVVGYNYQEFRYPEDRAKYPKRVILGSENGHQASNWDAVVNNDFVAGQYLWTGVDYLGEARPWPARSALSGLLDLAGNPKPIFYFRQSLWTREPMIYLGSAPAPTDAAATASSSSFTSRTALNLPAPTWNYQPGEKIRVTCYTNCEEAELFLNNQSLGRKRLADATEHILAWETTYQPGELSVKGFRGGKIVSSTSLQTAGEPAAIRAKTDLKAFSKGQKQVAHLEMEIVDKDGHMIHGAENEVTVRVEGPAQLLGLESGNAFSHERYKVDKRKFFHGRLLGYVQSQGRAGTVKVTISAAGLPSQTLTLPVR
ncbi:MAG TPA: glycoside hydrolase family 2 TIM barrel-domain containing protein [Abditibacterium sp.]|jgi:hypothetical protein